jgi:hypothetical protein
MNTQLEVIENDEFEAPVTGEYLDNSLALELSRVEIDRQIATARAYPRSLKTVTDRIFSLATLDKQSAEESMYALPRGGKPITGPSIRFAEIVKQSYGNCRAGARVVHVDRTEKYVEAEGAFHDLETNAATSARVRRRIVDSRGRLYSDDMIIVTGNAACSIALRNAIMGGVPKPLWRRAYEAVQSAVKGDITTLSENRVNAVKAFAVYGVKPDQVFAALGVKGGEDIGVDHIPILRAMFSTLKNGEETVESMFPAPIALPGAANQGLTERLRAQKDAKDKPTEGFNTTQGSTITAELDKALGDDQVPDHDLKTGEVTPPAAVQQRLSDRVASFKVLVDVAETTVAVLQLRADYAKLWKDVDAGDPDEVGTPAELDAYVNARCLEIEDAERAGA